MINESGVYHLIFKSRKPEAVRFRKWVTNEVLPAIRRTGRYGAAEAGGLLLEEERAGVYVLQVPAGRWCVTAEARHCVYYPDDSSMVMEIAGEILIHRARVLSREDVQAMSQGERPMLLSEAQVRKAELLDDIVEIEDTRMRRRMAAHVRALTQQ